MSYSFNGKHVLITGATGGLGSALTENLVGLGARVVVSDRLLETLDELKSTLSGDPPVVSIPADLSIPGAAEILADKALKALGHVDVLINNAGIGYHALMDETIEAKMREVYEINTFAPIALIKALLPSMKARGSGRVINILSCAGFIPTPTTGIYGASKAAFSSMARTLRLEVEPDGIKVFNFYPGPIATSFNENAMRENDRIGLFACGFAGARPDKIAAKILSAATGKPGDMWLDRFSKWLALSGTIWPRLSDRRLIRLRDEVVTRRGGIKPPKKRRWRLWQIESSIACNLNCIMCPWKDVRQQRFKSGDMSDEVWAALRPYLSETDSVDFTGGGEPLLHPKLAERIREAKEAGCRTGFLTNGLILNREMILQFIRAGVDWIGFSLDAATAETYEQIRKGSDFKRLCGNIAGVAGLRAGKSPLIMINFVMMPENITHLEKIVQLSAELGVDKINFKQCDVIRGAHGREYGLFASKETRAIRRFQKALEKARRLAKRLKIETSAFSFIPDELPVCAQDPRDSVFVRHDGQVAPCINLAMGGETAFLGENVNIPTVLYGRLPDKNLLELWDTEICRFYRQRFEKRDNIYNTVIAKSSFEASLVKLNETLAAARQAMPAAPEGCRVCHYLYDI